MTKRRRRNRYGFSYKRLFGLSRARSRVARLTGIPTTRQGRRRKLDRSIASCFGCLLQAFVCVALLVTVLVIFL